MLEDSAGQRTFNQRRRAEGNIPGFGNLLVASGDKSRQDQEERTAHAEYPWEKVVSHLHQYALATPSRLVVESREPL